MYNKGRAILFAVTTLRPWFHCVFHLLPPSIDSFHLVGILPAIYDQWPDALDKITVARGPETPGGDP